MAALIRSLLIANRGEIACRVIRTARRLGIRTVAVYSEADAGAMHVALADEAWPVGPAPARESYLDAARILDAARLSGAEAIHPGYGFLSENADFAAACGAAGIIFVGPPAAAIRAMGSKAGAKELMAAARVPLIPGYHGAEQDPARLADEAARIGYPVLLKPSAGGGGKGMKIVAHAADFVEALASARREAMSSFGDDRMLIERYLAHPRHIEVQIFADAQGNVVHLFERDCSIQRRHQKVIEEAPAPDLTEARRQAICAAAIDAARAVSYVGAGTVEFIAEGDAFFFMEMNTRLQVEHPVTEAITGLDLVEWQLRVASGEALPLGQEAIRCDGHAIEARLYAEDPRRDFLPQSGTLAHVAFPAGPGLRVDDGVRGGDAVSIHYDPLLAKLIAHGPDRDTARYRLRAGLDRCEIVGVATNRDLLRAIAADSAFAAGAVDTGFIARLQESGPAQGRAGIKRGLMLAALFVMLDARSRAAAQAAASADPWSPWGQAAGWRLNRDARQHLALSSEGTERDVAVAFCGDGFVFELDGAHCTAAGTLAADGALAATLEGLRNTVRVVRTGVRGEQLTLFDRGDAHHIILVDPGAAPAARPAAGGRLAAPMPGRVVQLHVSAGDRVSKGSVLVVVEAMKMEHAVRAPRDGVVARVDCRVGDLVEEGVALLTLAPPEASGS